MALPACESSCCVKNLPSSFLFSKTRIIGSFALTYESKQGRKTIIRKTKAASAPKSRFCARSSFISFTVCLAISSSRKISPMRSSKKRCWMASVATITSSVSVKNDSSNPKTAHKTCPTGTVNACLSICICSFFLSPLKKNALDSYKSSSPAMLSFSVLYHSKVENTI